jgi:hypothetical protein
MPHAEQTYFQCQGIDNSIRNSEDFDFLNSKIVFPIQNDSPFDLRVIDIRSTKSRVIVAVFIAFIEDMNVCASTKARAISHCARDRILSSSRFKSARGKIVQLCRCQNKASPARIPEIAPCAITRTRSMTPEKVSFRTLDQNQCGANAIAFLVEITRDTTIHTDSRDTTNQSFSQEIHLKAQEELKQSCFIFSSHPRRFRNPRSR